MAEYYPIPITALAQSDDDGTNGSNIVAGAVITVQDLDGNTVIMYDDDAGSGAATSKTTSATGQRDIYVTPGDYNVYVNGINPKRYSAGGKSALEVDTFANLELLRPVKAGQSFICQERANARYILQASGYVALPGDVTFANGRVGALQFDGAVNAKWFGAACDRVTDDSQAFQDAIDRLDLVGGGYVDFAGKCLIDSNLDVKDYICLRGSAQNPEELLSGGVGPDFDDEIGSQLVVNSAATITMRDGASVKDCLVIRKGLSLPFADEAAALAGIAAFAGTAFTAGGAGPSFTNLLIVGFEYAIYSNGYERVTCEYVRGDCTNGINIEGCRDISYINKCHFWPYATVHQTGLSIATLTRSGTAFKYANIADWCKVSDSFSYGYAIGVHVSSANSCVISGVGCDNIAIASTENTIGFLIDGTSTETKLIGCQTANQEYGYYVSTTSGGRTTITDCNSWVIESSAVLANSGSVNIVGGNHRTANVGVSVTSTDRVLVSGVRFTDIATRPIFCSVSNSNIVSGLNYYDDLPNGTSPVNANASLKSIASTAPLLLPANGEVFRVTGTAGFGAINGGYAGRRVTLIFDGALTVSDGGTINMAGNFVTTTGDTLTLVHDGSAWYEVSRSVN